MPAGPTLLIADDNRADRLLTVRAFRQLGVACPIREVADGDELLDYLRGHGQSSGTAGPLLVLLDINMPRKSGLEALTEIRASAELRHIPVVMLTTSDAERDVAEAYRLGANSFVTKPMDYVSFVGLVERIRDYWLELVTLPQPAPASPGAA